MHALPGDPGSITHVLYHASCADGFGAAYAAWKRLGDAAQYLPVRHGQPYPELPANARVAIVDFSYLREELLDLRDQVASLVVLDHHKSARDQLQGLDFAYFDMDRAGANLAWQYWHPEQPLPQLLAYVEDRDLWRFHLPQSREVSVALHSLPMEFATWDRLEVEDLRHEGTAILRYQQQQIERALRRVRLVKLGTHWVPAVNSCLFQSEIGDHLCQQFPDADFAAVYYLNQEGQWAWSLRSIGDFDVAEVARHFGGGGHKNAAGCAVDPRQLSWTQTRVAHPEST